VLVNVDSGLQGTPPKDSLTQIARPLCWLARRRCFSAKLARSIGVLFVSNGSFTVGADLDYW
jgi:hypothetical protein